jgi:prepilin-type N-terminal cleavage/methylation domain-containing protein
LPEYTLWYIPVFDSTDRVISMKNQKAFTLVEAIVTAVIMAILSAVAIPMYSGFIRDQRQSTVDNLAETAAAAANAHFRRTGVAPTPPAIVVPNTAPLNIYFNATNYRIDVTAIPNTITVTDLQHSTISAVRNY